MGFDLRTHIRDKETGELVKHQPYRLRITRSSTIFERNGVSYHPDGTQVDPSQKPKFSEAEKLVHDKSQVSDGLKAIREKEEKLKAKEELLNNKLEALNKEEEVEPVEKLPEQRLVEKQAESMEEPAQPEEVVQKEESAEPVQENPEQAAPDFFNQKAN